MSTAVGTVVAAPNASDPDYVAAKGQGGRGGTGTNASGAAGGAGLIVISGYS
jgi:hypothetical protein